MRLEALRDLYLDSLQDLYSAEAQLARALPRVAEAVFDAQLSSALAIHLQESQEHALRVERLLEQTGHTSGEQRCEGVEGLLREAFELIDRDADRDVRDAGLIAAFQKVEHYGIAAYGTARTYAEILGDNEGAQLLQETLNEKRRTDEKLSQIARSGINLEAVHGA